MILNSVSYLYQIFWFLRFKLIANLKDEILGLVLKHGLLKCKTEVLLLKFIFDFILKFLFWSALQNLTPSIGNMLNATHWKFPSALHTIWLADILQNIIFFSEFDNILNKKLVV